MLEQMPTHGILDQCAGQEAGIQCANNVLAKNTWTARDLYKFYRALYFLDDLSLWSASTEILRIDEPGISRGYLKNMARKMKIPVISKNGDSGSAITDAGILSFQGRTYLISVLSYNAFDSLDELFGRYDAFGNPVNYLKGLLQQLIEGSISVQ